MSIHLFDCPRCGEVIQDDPDSNCCPACGDYPGDLVSEPSGSDGGGPGDVVPEVIAARHVLGDDRAFALWLDALRAVHAYVHASGCPPGNNVIEWFSAASKRLDAAQTEARQGAVPAGPNTELEAINGRLA